MAKPKNEGPQDLPLIQAFLDKVFMEGIPHATAAQQLGISMTQLLVWRNDERYRAAFEERQQLAQHMMWQLTLVDLVASIRRKCKADDMDGHALMQGVARVVDQLGGPQQGQPTNPATGLPFLNEVFSDVLESERPKPPPKPKPAKKARTKPTKPKPKAKPAKEDKPVAKGTKKGTGTKKGSGGGKC